MRSASPAAGLWPPSTHTSTARPRRRRRVGQRAVVKPLQSRGPAGVAYAGSEGVGRRGAERAERGDGEAGVVRLVRAKQRGRRQRKLASAVAEAEAAGAIVRFTHLHSWPQTASSQPTGGARPERAERGGRLRADDGAHAGSQDARLFGGDRSDGAAEEGLVVEAHRRDDAERGLQRRHVCRVEAAAHAYLEQCEVGRLAREREQRRARRRLEERDRRAAVHLLDLAEQRGQLVLADGAAAEGDPLVERDEVRARVRVHALARRLQRRAHERNRRALAIGARHVDDGRQIALRLAERLEQPLDAAEAEVDRRRVQCGKS